MSVPHTVYELDQQILFAPKLSQPKWLEKMLLRPVAILSRECKPFVVYSSVLKSKVHFESRYWTDKWFLLSNKWLPIIISSIQYVKEQ